MGAKHVHVRQTMPCSLRNAAAICIYDWWRLVQTTAMHTCSAPRRRGAASAGEFKMGENHIPGKVRLCSPHQLIIGQ
jgi:hypothetical protein